MAQIRYCQCGEALGEPCDFVGTDDDFVVIDWMPECWRGSHEAARNSGRWPANGSIRIAVSRDCAAAIERAEGPPDEWPEGCEWVRVAVP